MSTFSSSSVRVTFHGKFGTSPFPSEITTPAWRSQSRTSGASLTGVTEKLTSYGVASVFSPTHPYARQIASVIPVGVPSGKYGGTKEASPRYRL